MEVKQNNKKLYHIQNMNIRAEDEPFYVFVFCDHMPNEKDLKNIYHNEFGHNYEMLDEFLTSSDIYLVHAEVL